MHHWPYLTQCLLDSAQVVADGDADFVIILGVLASSLGQFCLFFCPLKGFLKTVFCCIGESKINFYNYVINCLMKRWIEINAYRGVLLKSENFSFK